MCVDVWDIWIVIHVIVVKGKNTKLLICHTSEDHQKHPVRRKYNLIYAIFMKLDHILNENIKMLPDIFLSLLQAVLILSLNLS